MAVTKKTNGRVRLISVGSKRQVMAAADDYMRQHETGDSAKKTKRWLNDPVSDKQRSALLRQGVNVSPIDFSWTKYRAACMLNYAWNKQFVDNIVYNVISEWEKSA